MIKVARNLTRKQYSIRENGKVIGYAPRMLLVDCTFEVRESGRQRVIKNRRKEVHAFVVAKQYRLTSPHPVPNGAIPITYDPYQSGYFFDKETGEQVKSARVVYCTPNGVFALEVEYGA